MKKNLKSKKTSVNAPASPRTKPDITGFMAKIQEQLAFLGERIDALIGQAPVKPSEIKGPPATVRESDRAKFIIPPGTAQRPAEAKPVRGPEGGRPGRRRERALHKAVCADCQKDCEIPFKPSGTRPVYCEACFSKRKASRSPKIPGENKPVSGTGASLQPSREREVPAASVPASQRRVTVTKKGVGKVVISEVVAPAAREVPSRGRSERPASRPRR